MGEEACLNTYCSIIDKLKTGSLDSDNVPMFYLDSAGGEAAGPKTGPVKSGGFARLYDSVNVPVAIQNKADQDRCVFALKSSEVRKLGGAHAKRLLEDAVSRVQDLYRVNVSIRVVHLLFHWNSHSFFNYHIDEDGVITCIINLGPGTSTMHVAGSEVATYDAIGSAHVFPSKVHHRSGAAQRRCVKMAIFFDTEEVPIDSDDKTEDKKPTEEGSSSTTPLVKEEVKQE
jgi:hypothetical protein